jgi:hypothetical protein
LGGSITVVVRGREASIAARAGGRATRQREETNVRGKVRD